MINALALKWRGLFQAQVIKVAKIRDEVRVDTYTTATTPALYKVRDVVQNLICYLEFIQRTDIDHLLRYGRSCKKSAVDWRQKSQRQRHT